MSYLPVTSASIKVNVNITVTSKIMHTYELTFHSFGFLFSRITSCIIPTQHTRNLGFISNSMKQRELKKSVNLRCPTTAFKDIFALISFSLEKDGDQLSSLANWAEHTYYSRGAWEGSRTSKGSVRSPLWVPDSVLSIF